MALAALSALAAGTVFAAPAEATVFGQGISVHHDAHIAGDGAITLSGTYRCEQVSPMGAMQINATVVQEQGRQLTIGGEQAVCDGTERRWVAHAPGRFAGVRPGHATVTATLREVHFQGLMPRSLITVAQDTQDVEFHEER
ncbi:DUF6299 family protein [Streptomyces sp. NPDC096339]|uniref:DUF6299 family protein n=1 Tax=Streptomyces sp. NPDC096339 TaxID=3366086 RepID=UPI00380A59A7